MGKNNHPSRDQKRKAKLKKRSERSNKHESLAYHGKKYKTPEFLPVMYRTEIAIYEMDVIRDHELTDDEVEASLERFIIQLRQHDFPILGAANQTPGPGRETEIEEVELMVWNIRRNWMILAENGMLPGRDDLIGVLRTILNSLEIWRGEKLHARGYLQFLEKFIKGTGVNVRKIDPAEFESRIVNDEDR